MKIRKFNSSTQNPRQSFGSANGLRNTDTQYEKPQMTHL